MFVHIFVDIVSIHHGVDLKLDIVFFAELAEFAKTFKMCTFAAADFDVCSFVEGVAGDGYDVNVDSIPPEKLGLY